MRYWPCIVIFMLLFPAPATAMAESGADAPFVIEVVDEATGRGVPLIELRTTNELRHYTDSNGLIAFSEPGLMDKEVFFLVSGHGYEAGADGFGMRGVRLRTTPGETATVKVKRLNIAERLYRITGQGIYRDTLLAGREAPLANPAINGLVMGQDSVQSVIYKGKIRWFWGDTGKPSYPLGNFHMSGATSDLPGEGGLDPAVGINLEYFVGDDGFSRPMVDVEGQGVVWADGFMVLPDESGRERLVCHFERRQGMGELYEKGLLVYDDERDVFEKLATLPLETRKAPRGHPLRHEVEGEAFFYFPTPFPGVRVRATWEEVLDPSAYEAFTCLVEGSAWSPESKDPPEIDRDEADRARWSWKRGTAPVDQAGQEKLIEQGVLTPEEAWWGLHDAKSKRPVTAHGGSVAWNDYRDKWVMIAVEIGGEHSALGDVWYAEADAPQGPWGPAVPIMSHDKYSFYNPKHHVFLDQQGGRVIYFEGTYTAMFSGTESPTPRYDYNQIMYRLDLADERLEAGRGEN